MQLNNERMRHTGEGAEFLDSDSDSHFLEVEEGGKGRSLHRDLSTAQEREEYGNVRHSG